MKRIKFLLPVVLVALFTTSSFAQPKAINLEKVKMNADIAKELNAIIKANKALLSTLDKDAEKAQKMEWREELREMFGWYNDKSKDAEMAFIKDQMKKANQKEIERVKRIIEEAEAASTNITFIPKIVEDKNGTTTTVYEQFTSNIKGFAGKKLPPGAFNVKLPNPKPGKQTIGTLQQRIKAGFTRAIKKQKSNPSSKLPSAKVLQTIGKKSVASYNNAQLSTQPTSSSQTHHSDVPCVKSDRPNPADYDNDPAGFERAMEIYKRCKAENGQNVYLKI